MGKKSFRPSRTFAPGYPRLREVERGPLSRWGLLALGGLLAGDAGCTSAQAGSKSPTAQPSNTASAINSPPAPDGGMPSIPIPGGVQPQRIEPIPVPVKPDDSKAGKLVPLRPMGTMPAPRVHQNGAK